MRIYSTKILRISSFVIRFINNYRELKKCGPTEEVLIQRKFIIKREQNHYENTENFKSSSEHLNLQMNKEGINQCHNIIQGG